MSEPDPDLKRLEESIEPAVERRSRLEPYRDVILKWRSEGHSFRRIQAALAKNGIQVALMTLHEFVQRRAEPAEPEVVNIQPAPNDGSPYGNMTTIEIVSTPPGHAKPRKRTAAEIAALRELARASNHKGTPEDDAPRRVFEYDPDRPLTNKPRGDS